MSRYSFLLGRRWLGIIALGLVVSVTCALLGHWQLTRHQGRAAAAALVDANYDAPPVPLAELLPDPGMPLPEDLTWRPVELTGRYVGDEALVLPQRPISGSPADHVVAVFAAESGGEQRLVVVDRGWYPTDSFTEHGEQRALPAGEVRLTVRLRAAEPPTDRTAPAGQVYALAPEQVVAAAAEADGGASDGGDVTGSQVVTGAYGILATEDPTTPGAPAALPRPATDLGNNLSYAFQWWVFALGALAAVVILARREASDLGGGPPSKAPPARARRRTAEEEEDALIDAQLARGAARNSDAPAQANDTSSA